MGIRLAARIRELGERRDIVRRLAIRTRASEVWQGAADSVQWTDCPFCEQSPTGSYANRVVCIRCSSRRKLSA